MISLVSTVLNDRAGLMLFFEHIEAQTLKPDEIVIVDGGSTDGTWELLQRYAEQGVLKLQCLQEIGCNVAQGRNLAISHSSGDVIASTDIGCTWDPEWLEELIAPFYDEPSTDYVIGSWKVLFESLNSAWAKTEYVLRNAYIFEANPNANATSRSIAYRKKVWSAVGGYPEDLTLAGDDNVFDLLLKKHCFRATAAPIIRCYWHRFSQLQQYLREEKRNFYGAGEALVYRKHFVLVGGRILMETISIFGLIIAIFNLISLDIGLILVTVFFISFTQRMLQLRLKARQLSSMGISFALGRLLLFDYLAKLYGLWGYVTGFWHGTLYCGNCRMRLHHSPSEVK
jgi:glycosyltransferase involved in cell wall biosynthesis